MEEFISINRTGLDYDFIATVENNSDEAIEIVFYDEELEPITINGGDWIGILADENGRTELHELEAGLFEIDPHDDKMLYDVCEILCELDPITAAGVAAKMISDGYEREDVMNVFLGITDEDVKQFGR